MPWEHCGTSLADDQAACPECGASKASWTMAFNKTRVFQLSGYEGDPDAQAEALQDAADGSPFCEECQKQDNEEWPESEPVEEEEQPSAEEQAETLQDAADSGSPFCEQCQAQDNPDSNAA